jgi:hypothetical protein
MSLQVMQISFVRRELVSSVKLLIYLICGLVKLYILVDATYILIFTEGDYSTY